MSAARKTNRAEPPAPVEPTAAELAAENPYRFFPLNEVGDIFDFGRDVMTAICKHKTPPLIVARKMNPGMLMEWLKEHGGEIGKIRPEQPED